MLPKHVKIRPPCMFPSISIYGHLVKKIMICVVTKNNKIIYIKKQNLPGGGVYFSVF